MVYNHKPTNYIHKYAFEKTKPLYPFGYGLFLWDHKARTLVGSYLHTRWLPNLPNCEQRVLGNYPTDGGNKVVNHE